MTKIPTPPDYPLTMGALTILGLSLCVFPSKIQESVVTLSQSPLSTIHQIWGKTDSEKEEKDTPSSVEFSGSVSKALITQAIGHAEGNLSADGQKTQNYAGHSDPGNGKRNQGWCSDQGRGGGDVNQADQECWQFVKQAIPVCKAEMEKAGFEVSHIELLLNCLDLWNQAGPEEYKSLPRLYREHGDMTLARGKTFGERGERATGLHRAFGTTDFEDSVLKDQRRRVQAIRRVIQGF